jgi:hypothetical protein
MTARRGGSQPSLANWLSAQQQQELTLDNRQTIIEQCYAVPGQMWPSELGWLYDTFATSQSHAEVGTYCGRSLLASCGGMQPTASVLSVDANVTLPPLRGEWLLSVRAATMELIRQEVGIAVEQRCELSCDAARELFQEGIHFDSVFIDADHHYAECRADIESWKTLIRPGGIIAGHDYWPVDLGVMEAVNETLAGRFTVVPGTRMWVARL